MLSRTQESYSKHTAIHDPTVAEGEALSTSATSNVSAVSWGAIFAGAAAAAGLSLILLFVGAGLGLSVVSPWAHTGASAGALGTAAILWLSFEQLLASAVGGYLAGRLRSRWLRLHQHEVTFRDTAHGLITWAVASVASALLFGSVIGAVLNNGVQAAGAVAGTAVASSSSGPIAYFTDSMFHAEGGNGSGAAVGPQATDPVYRAEAARIFGDSLQEGHLSSEDSRYLAQLVAQRTGLDADEAEQRVDAAFTAVQVRVQAAKAEAQRAADKARKDSAYSALWFAIALLLGAFIASLSATFGGRQRDLHSI
ncbi:MAG TPA: hypothetical protein VGN70_02885 [Gammaproteobacteria bacterium]|jgi:hypothetical protein